MRLLATERASSRQILKHPRYFSACAHNKKRKRVRGPHEAHNGTKSLVVFIRPPLPRGGRYERNIGQCNHWMCLSACTDHDKTKTSTRPTRSAVWSGRPDLNWGLSAPKADALPGCATPRILSTRPFPARLNARAHDTDAPHPRQRTNDGFFRAFQGVGEYLNKMQVWLVRAAHARICADFHP